MTTSADSSPQPIVGCPRCGRAVVDPERCASCGLPLTGQDVDRLRVVVGRLLAITGQQRALGAEAATLRQEQAVLLKVLGGRVAPAPGRRPTQAAESRPEVVRDILLWLGSALVAVAALTFALFAWRRLGDGGRAGLLDRKSTRLNSSHIQKSRMPSSA